jgi:hypothetical protein
MNANKIFANIYLTFALISELFNDKGYQGHNAGLFDGVGQSSLMPGTSSMPFRRINLALGVHEATQEIRIFVVNLVHLAFTEGASLLFDLLRVIVIFIVHNDLNRESISNFSRIISNIRDNWRMIRV